MAGDGGIKEVQMMEQELKPMYMCKCIIWDFPQGEYVAVCCKKCGGIKPKQSSINEKERTYEDNNYECFDDGYGL